MVYRCETCDWSTTSYGEIDAHEEQLEPGHLVMGRNEEHPQEGPVTTGYMELPEPRFRNGQAVVVHEPERRPGIWADKQPKRVLETATFYDPQGMRWRFRYRTTWPDNGRVTAEQEWWSEEQLMSLTEPEDVERWLNE